MRLFLGIEVPEKVKEEIHSALGVARVTPKGWEDPHDYHLTLLFIGQTQRHQLVSILERMSELRTTPFSLRTTRFHFFNRRVLYLGFEHDPRIFQLRERILRQFPEFVRPGEKEFVPHLTVKRWQRYEEAQLARALENLPTQSYEIPVDGISLFKSEKDEEGHKYHVIGRVAFTDFSPGT